MMKITTLFIDIGGVLLTNGWDHNSRKLAVKMFDLDAVEMENRHRLTIDTVELGKLSLEDYLSYVVFYQKRSFTRAQFQKFMFAQSQAYPQMIKLISQLKSQYKLKIIAVSNETRELNTYRIKKFKLASIIDFFISSSYVHIRKPDADIFHLALDLAMAPTKQVIYLDDRLLYAEVAKRLGLQSVHHTDHRTTGEKLASFGLKVSDDKKK